MDAAEECIAGFRAAFKPLRRLHGGFSYEPFYEGEKQLLPARYAEGYTYGQHDRTMLMPHGRGVIRLNDVTISGPCFYKGEVQGYGECKLSNHGVPPGVRGAVYTGEFAAKKCTGQGTLVCPKHGMTLTGTWVSNKLHGSGKITQVVGTRDDDDGNPIPIVKTITVWAWNGTLYKTQKEWEHLAELGQRRQMMDYGH